MPVCAISAGPLWRLTLPEAFEVIAATGADGIEILVNQNVATQSPQELERLSNLHDLPIVAIHAPLLLLTRRVYTADPLEKIRRTLELAKALDVGSIVLHPPLVWQLRYALWTIHEMQDITAGTATCITMENMYPTSVAGRNVSFHRYGDTKSMTRYDHVTLDTSHLAVSQDDPVEAYEALRDRVVHIHLSDNRGKGRDSHAPLGEGILDIKAFIRCLNGPALKSIALEIHPGADAGTPSSVEKVLGDSLEMLRKNLPTAETLPPKEISSGEAPPLD